MNFKDVFYDLLKDFFQHQLQYNDVFQIYC